MTPHGIHGLRRAVARAHKSLMARDFLHSRTRAKTSTQFVSFCPRRRPTKAQIDVAKEKRSGEADGVAILRGVKSTFSSSVSPQGAYKSSTICYSPEKGTWTELEGEVAEPLAGPACSTVTLPACLPFNK